MWQKMPVVADLTACLARLGMLFLALITLAVVGKELISQLGYAEVDQLLDSALPVVLLIFLLTAATPFVPGAEIGIVLLMVFGAETALEVYLVMLSALIFAFCLGHLVPAKLTTRYAKKLSTLQKLFGV